MISLQSYVRGQWVAGSGEPKTLHDPSTEAALGEVRPAGVDFAAARDHALAEGGPALRAMGWNKRAEMLKGLAARLHEARDELIEIAAKNGGNTRGDAKFDLDGASGTLAFYAQLGAAIADGK